MTEARRIYGLLLAGGQSRRMGQDKALLDHDGQSQLAFAFELVDAVTDAAFVSRRTDQADDDERQQFPQIVDRYEDLGPVAGILSAFDRHPEVDWLVVACDLPNLDRETLMALIDEHTPDRAFTAYRSSFDGLPEPLCAIYGTGSEAAVRAFVDDGILCPRKMLIRSDTQLLDQPHPGALDNINTPDDLAGSVLRGG